MLSAFIHFSPAVCVSNPPVPLSSGLQTKEDARARNAGWGTRARVVQTNLGARSL
ncbi:MAG: hypothetical protein H0W99_10680 [Acidobacteria bacterium]|nr:hypothetical protein [Acidobacteriota bacterium]